MQSPFSRSPARPSRRAAVLAELTGLLDEATLGGGSAVLLYGEAWIGKTRTPQEVAADAVQRGFLVAWAGAPSSMGSRRSAPWQEVFTCWGPWTDAS